jgi:hypothetical protein
MISDSPEPFAHVLSAFRPLSFAVPIVSCNRDPFALGFGWSADPAVMEEAQQLFFRNLRRL